MEKLLNAIEKTIVELRQGQDDGLNLYKKNMPAVLDAISPCWVSVKQPKR